MSNEHEHTNDCGHTDEEHEHMNGSFQKIRDAIEELTGIKLDHAETEEGKTIMAARPQAEALIKATFAQQNTDVKPNELESPTVVMAINLMLNKMIQMDIVSFIDAPTIGQLLGFLVRMTVIFQQGGFDTERDAFDALLGDIEVSL